MDDRDQMSRWRRSGALRDLLVISLAAVALLWLLAVTGTTELLHRWLHREFPGQTDEILIGLGLAAITFGIFALTRWRQGQRELAARNTAEERYREVVETIPAVVYTWDPTQPPGTVPAHYVSPQAEAMLGFTPDEMRADPALWIKQIHPDDRERVLAASAHADRTGEPLSVEYRHIRKNGTLIWVREEAVAVNRDEHGRPTLVQGVMYDVTQRKLVEDTLDRRDTILRAVSFAAERFLKTTSWKRDLPEVLAQLGRAADASRVYVYENERGPGDELLMSQVAEWAAPGVVSYLDDPANQRYPYRGTGFESWEEILGAGGVFQGHAADFPEPVRQDLQLEQVVSIAVVPIFVGDDWWGYLGLDECRRERTWPQAELDALRAAADTLGAAIGRERAERRFSEAEGRYRTLVERLPLVTYIEDVDDPNLAKYVSPQIEGLIGYTPEEWLADPELWCRLLHPDDAVRAIAEDARTTATGDPVSIEYRFIARDGRVIWVRDEAVLLRDDQGHPIAWHGFYQDITERKEAEEQLRDAERRLRTLVEQIPAVTYVDRVDELSTVVYVSPQIETMFGYTAEAWKTGINLWTDNLHPNDRDRVLEALQAHKTQGVPLDVEYRFRAGDGRWMWVRDQATIVLDAAGGSRLSQGVMYDITGRRLAEEHLREAERQYRTLVETLPAVVYIDAVDEESTSIYVSGQTTAMLGYTPEDWRSNPHLWLGIIHPDDRARVRAAHDLHKSVGDLFDQEYRLIRKDGRTIWVRDVAVVVGDEEGRPLYSQGFLFDVTERRLIEEQLRETEQRYRALVEHIPAMLYVDPVDEHAPSIYVSPQSERVLGVAPEKYMADGDLWLEQAHPDDRQRVQDAYRRSLADAEGWTIEYRAIRPDNGKVVWVRDESVFLLDEHGKPSLIQGVVFDVTERKLAEEALQESERREREAVERLRALDEMKNRFLAAVSHELRSPLASILGTALTVARPDIPDEDRADLLDRLAQNARKLDRLLSDLIDIDRLNRGILTPQHRPTDLGALVRRTIESLDILGDRSIGVEAEPVVVPIEAAKVERIVENLIANAVRHTAPDVHIWVRVSAQDDGALLAVEDDGPGVPEDLRQAIFEPFRQGPTASPYAPGTGIGLSLVAMFAELHGGRAWVEDRAGGGSSFRVFFPAVAPGYPAVDGDHTTEAHTVQPDPRGAG